MKSLVIGYGSIGARHSRVLKELGCEVSVVSRRSVDFKPVYRDLTEALQKERPEYVVVATETSDHERALKELSRASFKGTVMIEKPVFGSSDAKAFAAQNVFIAYNLRFHPVIARLKKELRNEKPLSAQLYVGSYLPDWRAGTDYRKGYSAKSELGGGALRDLSHELDSALDLLGPWKRVAAIGGHFSALEISSDDSFGLLLETEKCPLVTVQMNYLDRAHRREISVIAERRSFRADLSQGKLWIDSEAVELPSERDFTYRAQHEAVLKKETGTLCTMDQGLEVMRLIEAAEKASRQKMWVSR